MPEMNLPGWDALRPNEPRGPAQLKDLAAKPSRHIPLEYLLGFYAVGAADEVLDKLRERQKAAVERLGTPSARATFGEPALMAQHALDCTDIANYAAVEGGHQYVPPEAEAHAIARMEAEHAPRAADIAVEAQLGLALEDPEKSSPELAARAVEYGRRHAGDLGATGGDAQWMRGQTVWAAAMVAMRDGTPELCAEHEAWARNVFDQALASPEDPVHRMRSGIRFNPVAIATVGLIHLWRRYDRFDDRERVLALAAARDPSPVHAFAAAFDTIVAIDPRMPAALLRCGLATSVVPKFDRDATEEEMALTEAERGSRAKAAVAAEIAWLDGKADEPGWPEFPALRRIFRRSIRFGGSPGRAYEDDMIDTVEEGWRADYQAAALWLEAITTRMGAADDERLAGLVAAYADWTATANGAGLPRERELTRTPDEWNAAFYALFPRLAPTLGRATLARLVEQVAGLPDRNYFDVAEQLCLAVDRSYFNAGVVSREDAVWLRDTLAVRLLESAGWRYAGDRINYSLEHHIGRVIAALMMNNQGVFTSPTCYLTAKGIERVDPFLPAMQSLFAGGPIFAIALMTLNLLEVAPIAKHAPVLVSGLKTWLAKAPDDAVFWVDHGLGRRAATLIGVWMTQDPSLTEPTHPLRADLADILAMLVRLGVTEASAIEVRLLPA